jgi:predicted lipoprotein with Yx(FWY)xxD motif
LITDGPGPSAPDDIYRKEHVMTSHISDQDGSGEQGKEGTRRVRSDLARRLAIGTACVATAAVLAGTATAGIVSSLGVAKRPVAGKQASIVVDRQGETVYELSGESLAHLQCVTWTCLKEFPPVEVRSAGVKVPVTAGVPGRLTVLRRVKANLYQVMLDNHPLYYYSGDKTIGAATAQGLKGPGGAWHVVAAG